MRKILLIIIFLLSLSQLDAQNRHPLAPVKVSNAFEKALINGTRSLDGGPGQNYWQQFTWYDINVEIIPDEKKLIGSANIRYQNNSPDTLFSLHLDLYQNVHAPGAMRNEPAEVTGGKNVSSVIINGKEAKHRAGSGARYQITETRLVIIPVTALPPNEVAEIEIVWNFIIPQAGAGGRMGHDSDNLFFIAYWYPQMTVYDDVLGWHPDPFLINAEFYHGFADYNLSISMPGNWTVMATGEFLNPTETLAPHIFERYKEAGETDGVTPVITVADFGTNATKASENEKLTWRFKAQNVRDVAFSATKMSMWDSGRASVGDTNGDGETIFTRIHSFYRETSLHWKESVKYQQHSISFFSGYTGLPYPWPHMTAVEAGNIIGGGMEFPMMTIIGDYNTRGARALQSVTAHELAHMWIPMIISTDERRYSWIDEGHTVYHTNEARSDFWSSENEHRQSQLGYTRIAGSDFEGEMMRHSDYHYSVWAFRVASYDKPAIVLLALRGVLGDELFHRIHQEMFQTWKFKHMYPWDMFNFFNSRSGKNLDWFWKGWYYETLTLDQKIHSVVDSRRGTTINIMDNGQILMPVLFRVTLTDGSILNYRVEVEEWLEGGNSVSKRIPERNVVKVEIDPDQYLPDINRENNIWVKQ